MSEWTESARHELERYCRRARAQVDGSGADADEVVDDLRRHVETEVERLNLSVVNAEDVVQLLNHLGDPGETISEPVAPKTISEAKSRNLPAKPGIGLLLFGVVLPVIALVLELATRICTGAFFDPMPTWGHVILVAVVPIINLSIWVRLRQGGRVDGAWFVWVNSMAAGVSAIYTLFFLPLMVPGVIAVIWFGLGFLPWAPCLALISTLKLRRYTTLSTPPPRKKWRLATGMFVGICLVIVPDLPSEVTRLALQWADESDPVVQQRGINWLRSFGHEETMLRACYERPRRWTDFSAMIASPNNPVTQNDAREIFYRVTGKPFNSLKPPPLFTRGGRFDAIDNEFTWEFDNALGGEAVAGRVRGLSLVSSRYDGLIESDAALGYGEWILEFRNDSRQQREARAQILLPPGGVVSRLTLWVNGEEREAAFGGRSQVREAYQKVAVEQRRDPVLVTTAGPDRVLMQCFPVPPNGGLMKVRVGITSPLHLADRKNGFHVWPRFLERNFNLSENLNRSIWIASRAELSCASDQLRVVKREDGRTGLQGEVTERAIADPNNVLKIRRADPAPGEAWSRGEGNTRIEQTIQAITNVAPKRLIVVMDGSAPMLSEWPVIADALSKIEGVELHVIVATDAVSDGWVELTTNDRGGSLIEQVRHHVPAGGQDNVAALRRGWDLAAGNSGNVLLWIHAPIPVLLESIEGLRQRLERNPGIVRFRDFQVGEGPNRLVEKLDGLRIQTAFRQGDVAGDLERLLASFVSGSPELVFQRRQWVGVPDDKGEPASKHVARLWALSEARSLAAQRKFDRAVKLAREYQLVTPLTGAVVLETQAQYDAADLMPVDAMTVPVVPEPSVILLIALGLAAWFVRSRFRQNVNVR